MTYIGSPPPAGGGGADTIGYSGIAFGNTFVTNPDSTTSTLMFQEVVSAGKLANNGEVIRFIVVGDHISNFDGDDTFDLTLNGSPIGDMTQLFSIVAGNGASSFIGEIMRSGASFQQITVTAAVNDTLDVTRTYYTGLPINSAGSLVIKGVGGAATSGTVSHHFHKVWWEQA